MKGVILLTMNENARNVAVFPPYNSHSPVASF
jgi:hypothetical protein